MHTHICFLQYCHQLSSYCHQSSPAGWSRAKSALKQNGFFVLCQSSKQAAQRSAERFCTQYLVSRCPSSWGKTGRWWGWGGLRRGWAQHWTSDPSGSGSRQGQEKDQDPGCPAHQDQMQVLDRIRTRALNVLPIGIFGLVKVDQLNTIQPSSYHSQDTEDRAGHWFEDCLSYLAPTHRACCHLFSESEIRFLKLDKNGNKSQIKLCHDMPDEYCCNFMDRLMAINVLIMIRTDLTPPNPNDDDGNRPLMAFPVESRRRNCVSRVSAVTLHLHPFWTFTVMMRMPKIHDFMSKINIS